MYKSKSYYWTCPYCGNNLDPGEKCDCRDEKHSEIEQSNTADNYKSVQGGEINVSENRVSIFCNSQ